MSYDSRYEFDDDSYVAGNTPKGGDYRGAWRASDEGPPDAKRPDDNERELTLTDDEWMLRAGWVRTPGGWGRPA